MPDFIRPEAQAALRRWRELIAAAGAGALGLWWGLASFGPLKWIGWLLVAVAVALIHAGLQRMRFARGGGGPGIVTIDERRVVYYGPLTGGVADLDALERLELEPRARPAPHWILTLEDGASVEIPVNAEGADALFDLFAALPGIRTEHMLSVLSRTPDARVTVWAARPVPEGRRLH